MRRRARLIDLDYTAGKHCLGNAIADLCPTESPSKAELGTKPVGHGPTTLAGLNDADGVLTGIAAVFYPPYTKLSGGAGPVIFYDDPSIIEPQIGWTEYSEYTKLCAGWVEPGVENLVDQGWAKLKVIQKQAQSATATAGAATEITPHRPVRRCNSMNTNLQQAAINLGRLNYKVFYSAAGLGLGSQGDPAKVPDVVPKAGQGVSVFNLEVSDSMTGEAATKKAAAAVGLGAARTWSLFERVRLGNSLLDRALADNEPVTGATVQRRHNRQLQLKRNPVKEAATLGNKPDSSRAIQGFLGHRTANAGWQQTYCVCEPPEQCGGAPAVACFTDQFCSEHQGRIELDGSLVFTSPPLIPIDLEAPSRYGFAIVRDRFRFKYFFTAATVAERDSWLYALTAHIYVPRQITRCRVPVPPTQRAPEPLVSDRSKQLLARLPQVVPVPPPRSPISGRKWKMLAAHFGRSTGGGNTKLQPNGQAAGLTTARVAPPSRPPPPPSRPPPPSSMATGNAKPGRPPPPSGPLTARQSRTASAGAEYRNRDLAQKRWTLLKAMPKQAPMPPPRRKLPARAKAAIMTPAPPPSVPPSVPPLSQSDCSTSEPGLPASTNPFSIVPPPTVQVDPTRIASTNPFAEHEPTQVTTAKRETLSEYREPSPEEAGPALVTKDGSDEDFY